MMMPMMPVEQRLLAATQAKYGFNRVTNRASLLVQFSGGNSVITWQLSRDELAAALNRDEIAAWIHGGPCGDVAIEPGRCCGGHLDAADRVIAGILGGNNAQCVGVSS